MVTRVTLSSAGIKDGCRTQEQTVRRSTRMMLQLFVIKMVSTVLPAKSDSDVMFCLQSYQGLRIDRSRVY